MNDKSRPESAALIAIHKKAGSWPGVAEFLNDYAASGRTISSALAWKVANGRCNSHRVTMALVRAGMIKQPPPVVEVQVCYDCGQVHDMQRTCPSRKRKDDRRRRAWAGSAEDAEAVDRIVRERGFDSLAQLVDSWLDEEHEDDES